MTIESQNQLLNPKDRLALRVEAEFKLRNQQQYPDPFDAHIFIDHETEEVVRSARTKVASNTSEVRGTNAPSSAILKCRVYNEDFYHTGQENPLEAKSMPEYKAAINQCQEGYIRADHVDLPNLVNGSIWSCTMKGQTIQVLSLVQATAFSFSPSLGKIVSSPSAAFGSGTKRPLGANPRAAQSEVKIEFKRNSPSLINQSKKFPYVDFLPLLSKKLSSNGYSQVAVVVTSMFRGPTDQVNAMMSGRISQGDSQSYNSFKAWSIKNYGYRPGYGAEVQAIIAEKDWSTDVAGLKSKLISKITEQYNAGRYISNHMESGAIDLRTNDLNWSDVEIILKSLGELKAEGPVKKYQIENKRKMDGSYIPSAEHVHFSLASKGGPGE